MVNKVNVVRSISKDRGIILVWTFVYVLVSYRKVDWVALWLEF